MKTWTRVQDDFAQFDHPKGEPLPDGVTPVKDAEEYVGQWARDPKRRHAPKGGNKRTETDAPKSEPAKADSADKK